MSDLLHEPPLDLSAVMQSSQPTAVSEGKAFMPMTQGLLPMNECETRCTACGINSIVHIRTGKNGESWHVTYKVCPLRFLVKGCPPTFGQAYEERRRKKDEAREAQAVAEEEEAAQKEAAKQAADDAEAAKWLSQISTEKEGNEATEDAEKQVHIL